MPGLDQLEVISASGAIRIYDLDPVRGITNIGRHPDNDIVLDGSGVAPFHMLVDHRQRPVRVMAMDPQADTWLEERPLSSGSFLDLRLWDTLKVGGFTLILLAANGAQAEVPPSAPAPPGGANRLPERTWPEEPTTEEWWNGSGNGGAIQPGRGAVAAPAPGPAPLLPIPAALPQGVGVRPSDFVNDFIPVDLPQREWTINCNESAVFELMVANGGDVVAAFIAQIDGVDPSWVTITPPRLNLFEGDRGRITVIVTPPQAPTSRAKTYYATLTVRSPEYPDQISQVGASVTVNPFYDFFVHDLSPRRLTLPWRKQTGETGLALTNRSNTDLQARVEGTDDERSLSFEFEVSREGASLAQRAEVSVPSDSTQAVPILITPHSRRLVGLRKRTFAYAVTVTAPNTDLMPRTVMGQLIAKPLIGPGLILLMSMLLLMAVALIFRPFISEFDANTQQVNAGSPVVLRWRASRFATLRINGDIGLVQGPVGQVTAVPTGDVTYVMEASNLLSRAPLVGQLFASQRELPRIVVTPIFPNIRFEASPIKDVLIKGQDRVTLSWVVEDATDVTFEANGVVKALPTQEFSSQYVIQPGPGDLDGEQVYRLVARNAYSTNPSEVTKRFVITSATPTPVPSPAIQFFDVQPSVINAGEKVNVRYLVTGATTVNLTPFGSGPTDELSIEHTPTETTLYRLTVSNAGGEISEIRQVVVNPAPTATPVPQPPLISFFNITSQEVILGSKAAGELTVAWSTVGTTNVEISGPDIGTVSNLPANGSMAVVPRQNTIYVLTAYNGDLKISQTINLKVLEPTMTPTGTPPPTPLPTATPMPPAANIIYFTVGASDTAQSDRVVPLAGTDNRYQVTAGTKVKFRWGVQNAVEVQFDAYGAQPFPDGEFILPTLIVQTSQFLLRAKDGGGNTFTRSIILDVVPPAAPPSPLSVGGSSLDANQNQISWQYPADKLDSILGFRLYRIDLSTNSTVRVAGEGTLTTAINQYTDIFTPSCGKAYYVVATYVDITDPSLAVKETGPSSNSWFSVPCP